ncbi:DUF2950 family protein [Albimonas pacifica]|uniref:DUF2950 domain-containing protein n=1 Tax=Albimonas pacifica TaxID=1114924 RepID=A0A1I3NG84_9RHOB|nr:DUF2950 family protein [Albimonas pacifica]SFJ08304.1 Protein of unknown function [Albimonas pacifica]
MTPRSMSLMIRSPAIPAGPGRSLAPSPAPARARARPLARAALGLALGLACAGALRAEPAAYPSPREALEAVVAAVEAADRDALLAVFGPEAEDVVFTGDPAQDRENWSRFLADYRVSHRLKVSSQGWANVYIGEDQHPFPASIYRNEDGTWAFDAEEARDAVHLQRIGANELDVIALMHAYVGAQARFRQVDYDGDGQLEFAAHVLSDAETRDGLYWPPTEGAPDSPIGDFMARASADGYAVGDAVEAPEPYLGYYFRVLTGQGPSAPGGAMSYLVNGQMLAGHALLAFPADYGGTGVMSFLVAENGVVLQADLGEDTLERADAVELYDPDASWSPAD